ncbi:MAG TPA: amidohydrolase [Planctomycetota bacterium]|nr:amidohydrolase [Planctomycetota bacterium]
MKNASLALLLLAGCAADGPVAEKKEPADLIIYHARIITVDLHSTIAEAIAVKDGRIVELGPDEEVLKRMGPRTKAIDAEGRAVLPGLFDSHVHTVDAATSELGAPLPEFRSLKDVSEFIKAKAASTPQGQWIVVPYAFPTRLKEARFPTRAELDALAPNHPVLYHAGPSGVANSKALQMAGITRDTASPPFGVVVKDPATGEPTGMLRGTSATGLLKAPSVGATGTAAQKRAAVKKVLALYNAEGITSIADRDAGPEELDTYLDLEKSGELTVRVNVARNFSPRGTREEVMKRLDDLPRADKRGGPTGAGTDWVRVGPIKLYMDGGMLNGSAYMREPWPKGEAYQIVEDGYRGLLFVEPRQLEMVLEEAAKRGWQMTAHTAGEGAMDTLLDAYEAVDKKVPIGERRFCITHANFPSQRNLERCKRLGVMADVQPAWLWKDGTTLLNVLGDARMRWFQPYKTWMQYTIIGGGSDHMIRSDSIRATNPWNPWLAMWCTVTRLTEGGKVLFPEERLTRDQAIRLYTINNAVLTHEDEQKGSLEVGKLADLILVDRDPLNCPVNDLLDTSVLMTVVGGKIVYSAEK